MRKPLYMKISMPNARHDIYAAQLWRVGEVLRLDTNRPEPLTNPLEWNF